MKYDDSNLDKRINHFELLNKLAIDGKLSKEDSIKYINLLIKQNPYTYKTSPAVEVRNPEKNEKKEKTNGSYNYKSNKVTFILPKENITWQNLRKSAYVVGHEMKHYFQHKNLSNFYKLMENYKNQYALKQFDLNNFESTGSYMSFNKIGFRKVVKQIPLTATRHAPILALKMSKNRTNATSYAVYYTTHHEYDARKAGENFAYGMMKSYANDPLIEKYPKVKKMFSHYIDNNSEQADQYHKNVLNELEILYKKKEAKLASLNKSLTKLALNGQIPNNNSIVSLTCHLLVHFYNKDTILNVIKSNLNTNNHLSSELNFYTLFKCPKQDLKEFQELYVQNVLNNNYKTLMNIMLSNEQNQLIIDKIITKDQNLKLLNTFTANKNFKNILTDSYSTKMVNEIIDTFDDKKIDYQDLFSLSMDLIPKLSKNDATKLDEFYKKKYNELEKNENGNNQNDFIVEYDHTI